MTPLKDTIAALFERAASGPAEATVARGLHLKARFASGRRQLLLTRPDVRPSDLEVTTCARHGGFVSYEVTAGLRWQLIAETAAPSPAATCGTCANGTPGQYPNEVECQLGWDRHDGVLRPLLGGKSEWIPVPVGHGTLALPVLHPAHRCVAVIGGNRPGWAARA